MKIIIEMNDNEYAGIKEYPDNITSYPVTIHLYDAVRNGTPLPKGHGRLIDADKIVSYMDIEYDFDGDWKVIDDIGEIPTIIEADKEGD